MFDFTPDNAHELLVLLSPLLPVLATYLTTRSVLRAEYKFAISFLAVTLVAILTAYSQGQLGNNFWSSLTQTFTIAQGIYWGIFKGLGLEKILFPIQALQSAAAEQAKVETANVSSDTAKAILDPDNPQALNVSANVVNKPGEVI